MRRILPWFVAGILAVSLPAFARQAQPSKTAQAKPPASPVNINTASEADLEALPGVGPATAKKIIAGRPYASVADLSRAGVPKSTINKISSMVTVGTQAGAGSGTSSPPPAAPRATPPAAAGTTGRTNAPAAAQQPPVKGMVWVNLDTKVFHREGDRYYGNTKHGKFMTEEDALKAGYREAKNSQPKKPK